MTEPLDDAGIDAVLRAVPDADARVARRQSLGNLSADVEGPLGELLRTVSAMHAEWLLASDSGVTTDAESCRMERITDSAVECVTWLRGEQ